MAKKFKETYPEDVPAISSIKLKTADGINTINSITKENNNENSIEKTQQELMNEKGFKMVGKKGHAFPMLQPDPVEEQKKKMMEQQGIVKPENRAGSAQDRNVLVNDPNNPQPANKVSANVNGREQMFNNMASNPGQPYPDASTTPPAPIFPNQQGSFAAYANPKRVREDLSGVDVDAEGGLKSMMDKLKKKRNTKVGNPVTPEKPEDPAMYDGLSKALVGDQDNLPEELQKEILNSSAMYDEAPALIDYDAGIRAEKRENKAAHKKAGKARKAEAKAEVKQEKAGARKAKNHARAVKVKSKINNFKVNQAKKKELKGQAPGMHEKHTQISKANVNAAMRDDAAHASYLKRDINYDNKHGGSKKQMTADEKHISKLAGDIKYDVKKKRKYDNV